MGERGTAPPAKAPTGHPVTGRTYRFASALLGDYGTDRPDEADDWDDDVPTEDRARLTGPYLIDAASGDQGSGRKVLAEWALWGKAPGDPNYGVLRCSQGNFRPGDFGEIITRYTSGAKDSLPQYTVCWIPDEDGPDGYMGVAIQELADPDPRASGGRVRASRGREIEYVRLFCVRYRDMAKHRADYAELVESVRDCPLTTGPASPIEIELVDRKSPLLPVRDRVPGDFALAKDVATLLLTTRPICVLGAELTTAEDRLRFIDAVMSLLPYGLRAALSASTWASATARDLKLRLFFASSERDDGGMTAYVSWGHPVRLDNFTAQSMPLRHYVNWLERNGAGVTGELAAQADPVRFESEEIRQMVANLPKDWPVRDVLEELADGVRHNRLPVVEAAVRRLENRMAGPLTAAEKAEYRQTVKRLGLLKAHPKLADRTSAGVYGVLLDLIFGPELKYENYCRVEEWTGGPPCGLLGQTMLTRQFSSYLPWMLTMSATQLTAGEVMDHLRRQGVPAAGPITEFQRYAAATRPEHRQAGYDLTVGYLRAYAANPKAELAARGYLAETLETAFPHDQRAQRTRLTSTLVFVYDGMLSQQAIAEIHDQLGVRPTAAMAAVVADLTIRAPGRFRKFREGFLAVWERIRDRKIVVSTALVLALMAIVILVIIILVGLLIHRVHG